MAGVTLTQIDFEQLVNGFYAKKMSSLYFGAVPEEGEIVESKSEVDSDLKGIGIL